MSPIFILMTVKCSTPSKANKSSRKPTKCGKNVGIEWAYKPNLSLILLIFELKMKNFNFFFND